MGKTWKGWGGSPNQDVAKVWVDHSKGVLCARFPYKEEVIVDLRQKVPKGKKIWNPDQKIWEFSIETIDLIVEILQKHFDEVLNLTEEAHSVAPLETGDSLLSLLDKADIKAIYLLLVKKYHPDIGGDPQKMAEINRIFNKIK